jgi:hypothetical protein
MLRLALFATGVALSSIAAFYSVTGLAHIFASAFWPVVIMGGTLEVAKLVAASWLFRHWRTSPKPLVMYVASGVLVLMLLTGIGIFGYLSRAYLVQQAPMTQMVAEQTTATRNVQLAKDAYTRDETALNAFVSKNTADQVIGKLSETNRLGGTNGAVNVLRQQQAIQKQLQEQLRTSGVALKDAETALAAVNQRTQEQTVDVGPLLFVAKAWYGSTEMSILDHVVTVFILIIIFVFDPMAIALLLAAQSVTATTGITTSKSITTPIEPVLSQTSNDTVHVSSHSPQPTIVTLVVDKKNKTIKPTEAPVETNIDTDTIAMPSLENATIAAERPKYKRARLHAEQIEQQKPS